MLIGIGGFEVKECGVTPRVCWVLYPDQHRMGDLMRDLAI